MERDKETILIDIDDDLIERQNESLNKSVAKRHETK